MNIENFKIYTVDPMIDSWSFHLPYVNVYGFILKLPFTLSKFIISVLYHVKGYSMFKIKIITFRYWEFRKGDIL
tara:strand:- start:258 stop:479 length:222 start_codon:yes stop_codon:yes gene_type:complete